MNDRRSLDQQQLEQATSRELPANVQLDDETRQLREGWLALGRSLEQSRDDFDADALVARLQAEAAATPPVERKQPPASTTWWAVLLGTALALTMMVAAIRSLNTANFGDSKSPIAALPIAAEPGTTNDPVAASPTESAIDTEEAIAWSDPLDDELDEASELVQSLVAQPPTIDDSLSGLSEQLQSLASEFENGSL